MTYTSPLSDIVKNFDVSFHQYADDMSLYSVLSNHSVSEQLDNLYKCTDAINDWHLINFLNTEIQSYVYRHTQAPQESIPSSINIAGTALPSSTTLKLLGVTFDSHLKQHAISIIKSCNHLIWAIRHICPFLSVDTTSALARSLVLSHLDYCNSLLYGTSASLIHSLQRTQNNLANLILLNPSLNSSECLRQLHWLPIHLHLSQPSHSPPPYPQPPSFILCNPSTPIYIYNHSTDHPSSIEVSPMPRLLSGTTSPHHSVSTHTLTLWASVEDPSVQDSDKWRTEATLHMEP